MALLYQATLIPSKIEILKAWMPTQSWFPDVDVSSIEVVGAYRFDDPEDAVGLETLLLRCANGQTLQIPLTYRDAPLDGVDTPLITTAQHSVLGKRWVYDACGDPVYAAALANTILTGATGAEFIVATDEGHVKHDVPTHIKGSGSPEVKVPDLGPVSFVNEGSTTTVSAGSLELVVLRVIDTIYRGVLDQTLSGTWPGNDEPTLLAGVRVH